jgi:uncharacterized protein YjiS (DUF1127 family)
MIYNNVSTPASVLINEMAATRRFFERLGQSFEKLITRMMENSSGSHRVQAVRRLEALSDDELANLNLKREDIVHFVFKDLFYWKVSGQGGLTARQRSSARYWCITANAPPGPFSCLNICDRLTPALARANAAACWICAPLDMLLACLSRCLGSR